MNCSNFFLRCKKAVPELILIKQNIVDIRLLSDIFLQKIKIHFEFNHIFKKNETE